MENCNDEKRQERRETKKDKYHSGNNKAKLIEYYDFHTMIFKTTRTVT